MKYVVLSECVMANPIEYKTHDHFCLIHFTEQSFPPLDALIKSLPEHCRLPAEALKRNLRATALTATIPYQMAFASVWRRNYDFTVLLEKLEGGRNIHARAEKKHLRNMLSVKNRKRHADHIHAVMNDYLRMEEIRFAAAELIRQCTVQTWSALEVFASDIFVSLLNAKSTLALALIGDEKAKKLFQLKGIPLEVLSEYNFDLTSKMGTLLAGYHPIDTIPSMKAVFGAVLPNRKAINRALSIRELWLLFQRRHLIVHRRGIVDSSYLSSTGDKVALGSVIHISPDVLETYINVVIEAATAIGVGATAELRSS
jgi:hypothetical protein